MPIRPRWEYLSRAEVNTLNSVEAFGLPHAKSLEIALLIAKGYIDAQGNVTDAGRRARQEFYDARAREAGR